MSQNLTYLYSITSKKNSISQWWIYGPTSSTEAIFDWDLNLEFQMLVALRVIPTSDA